MLLERVVLPAVPYVAASPCGGAPDDTQRIGSRCQAMACAAISGGRWNSSAQNEEPQIVTGGKQGCHFLL
eukprot:6207410-Heterocapsa_arctica.AAC.1